VSGALSDRIGCAAVLRWSLALTTVAHLASALAPDADSVVALRVLCGIGVGAATPPIFSLATALAPEGRSCSAVALVSTGWIAGSITTASAALLTLDNPSSVVPSFEFEATWRLFATALATVPALATAAVWAVDLSAPARHTHTHISGVPPPAEHSLVSMTANVATSHILPLSVAWFGLNFGSYGLSTWITPLLCTSGVSDPYLVALVYSIGAVPGSLATIVAIDAIGSRALLVGSMSGAAISAYALGAASGSGASQAMVISAAFGFSASSTAGWNCLNALSTTSIQPPIRATVFSLVASSGRIGSISAQLVNGALITDPEALLRVTSAVMVLGCASAIMVPTPRPASAVPHEHELKKP